MGNYGLCGLFGKLVIGGRSVFLFGSFGVLCVVIIYCGVEAGGLSFTGGFWVCRLLLLWGLTTGGGCRPTYGTNHNWDDTNFPQLRGVRSVVDRFCG